MTEQTVQQAVEQIEHLLKLEVNPTDSFELRVMKAWIAAADWQEQKRIAGLPVHNAKVDPLNEECPFAEGTRVRLTQPLPGENEHGIQVGDEGVIGKGFAGVRCVYFNTAPRWGLMSDGDVWITDLCEEVKQS